MNGDPDMVASSIEISDDVLTLYAAKRAGKVADKGVQNELAYYGKTLLYFDIRDEGEAMKIENFPLPAADLNKLGDYASDVLHRMLPPILVNVQHGELRVVNVSSEGVIESVQEPQLIRAIRFVPTKESK